MSIGRVPGATGIQPSIVDAKGDIIAATAADSVSRLAVGANDLLLTAASGEATGLKYTGGWTTWTPSYTNITVGNGTVVARYQQIGKLVTVFWKLTFGSTSSFGADPRFTLPINASNITGNGIIAGSSSSLDSGVGEFPGVVQIASATTVYLMVLKTDGTYAREAYLSATVPMTWTTNDSYTAQFSYEVA